MSIMANTKSSSTGLAKPADDVAVPGTSFSNGEVAMGIVEELGYSPSYRRVFEGIGSFALVLSVASPMAAITIISGYQITYGGYWGLTWGWIIPSVLLLPQPLAIAELCSSMPVNGANYWWTAALAPPSLSRPLSFIAGWITVSQIITSLASLSYAGATSLSYAVPTLCPSWEPNNTQIMAIAMGLLIFWGLTSFLRMERIAWVFVLTCTIVLVTTSIYLVALPVSHSARHLPFAPASKVFGEYRNWSDWGSAVSVPTTFFSAAWSITGWNAPSYVVEETKNARVVSPRSIIQSYAAMAILGGIICIITAFCITDMESTALDPSGLPLYTLIFTHFGTPLGATFFLLVTCTSMLGGSSFLLTSASQMAAFARDGGLPFSKKLAHVNTKTNMPIYSQGALVIGGLLILLFGLSNMAREIIFSLAAIANFMMLMPPILLRIFARGRFVPGPFTLGRFSKPVHIWAFLSLIYMIVMMSFPPIQHWTINTFNYNWVVALGALLLAIVGWFTLGNHYPGLDLSALEVWRGDHEEHSLDYE